MLDDVSHEVGCDRCFISTADSEDAALAGAWLVDMRAEPHRHTCPVCLAVAPYPVRERISVARLDRSPNPEFGLGVRILDDEQAGKAPGRSAPHAQRRQPGLAEPA